MTVRVLIVEGHDLLRKGLCYMIAAMSDFEVVGQASNGRDGIHQAVVLQPDLILIDLFMAGISGFETTSRIRKRLPDARTVILSGQDNEDHVREALRIGANGYLLKEVSFEEFSFALNLIVRGRKYFCNQTSMQMLDLYIKDQSAPRAKTAWDRLSERERSVMKLIAEGYTNRAAGQFLCISCKTVEKHRASLMRKLALRNAAELVMMAIDMGLVERQRPPARTVAPSPYPQFEIDIPAIELAAMDTPNGYSASEAA